MNKSGDENSQNLMKSEIGAVVLQDIQQKFNDLQFSSK